jgi:DNA invertase Pin-like site-specific DNA recombinase
VSDTAGRNGDGFISPDVQRETIQRLAVASGLRLGEVVEELDVSGGKKIDRRELGRLVRKVEAGESEGIIFWRLSRFSRSLQHFLQDANPPYTPQEIER